MHLRRDAAGGAGIPGSHRRVRTTPEDLDGEEESADIIIDMIVIIIIIIVNIIIIKLKNLKNDF